MSVAIFVVRIEACSDDGDRVEVKIEGLVEPLDGADLERAKQRASDLFEEHFGELPYEILVHDSMKHRAEREGEDE